MKPWQEIFKIRRSKAASAKPATDGLMTLDQAAEYLGISPLTIYGWTSKKKMPFRKVGRLLRFDRAELDAWTKGELQKEKGD